MAQSNVAREPSMDEILASIRKIIESNEPGLPGFNPANPGGSPNRSFDDDGGDIHLTIDDADLVADFEAETRSSTPAVEAPSPRPSTASAEPAVTAPAPALSLADVAARVRAASERHASAPRDAVASAPVRSFEFPPLTSPQPQPVATPTAAVQPANGAATTGSSPSVAPVAKEQPVLVTPATVSPEAIVEDVPASPAPAVVVDDVPATGTRDGKTEASSGPILSAEAGREVARSFDDLAHALDHSARRSFDEIAEDMLRPMLQEWLDDNLPTLVERLVREEIERVARGPRR